MTLKSYYDSLENPQSTLRDKIVAECGISIPTFYKWLRGAGRPRKSDLDKISAITGIPGKDLFPTK